MKEYYFDNAATTYPKSENVYQALDSANRNLAFNAGRGSYDGAKKAMDMIDQTRDMLLGLAKGNSAYDVIFTSSATLALNEIIMGMDWSEDDCVYISPYEHNAVIRTLHQARIKFGFKVITMPLNEDLSLDLDKLEFMFSGKKPGKIFITYVSNVTGYILPVEQVTYLAKKYGATVICDASQALGLIPINLRKIKVDYLIFAGHKTLYGGFGIGGFYMKIGLKLSPGIAGGTGTDSLNPKMPNVIPGKLEAGSHNIVAIAGLNEALREIKEERILLLYYEKERKLTGNLVKGLKEIDGIKLYLPKSENHIGIVSFNLGNFKSQDVGSILNDDYAVAVRTGYHCAPLIHQYLKDELYLGVVRASVGRYTEKSDIDYLVNAIKEIAED